MFHLHRCSENRRGNRQDKNAKNARILPPRTANNEGLAKNSAIRTIEMTMMIAKP